jgi:hypothetical protein
VIVEDKMEIVDGVYIDLLKAFELFIEYRKRFDDKQIIRRTDFKRLLKAAFPELIFEKRNEKKDHGKACIRRLRERQPGSSEVANIVAFPNMPKPDVNNSTNR